MKKSIAYRNRLSILATSAIVLSIILSGNQASAAGETIYFDPATAQVSVGDTFSLVAKVNPNGKQVGAVDLYVSFDASVVRLDSITNAATFSTQLGNTIDNTNGTAYFAAGRLSVPPYVTTTSDIATFSFTALATGTSNVNFGNGTQAAAIEGDLTSNAGSAVTVGSPAPITYNATDFAHLLSNWLQTVSGAREVGNLNTDNVVNTRDLGIMMSNWAL